MCISTLFYIVVSIFCLLPTGVSSLAPSDSYSSLSSYLVSLEEKKKKVLNEKGGNDNDGSTTTTGVDNSKKDVEKKVDSSTTSFNLITSKQSPSSEK